MSGVDTQRCVFVGEEKTKAGKNRVVPILSIIRPFVEYFYERATEALFLSGYAWHINGNNFRRRDYYPTFSKILEHADFDATSDIYIQADLSKLHQEMSKLASCED